MHRRCVEAGASVCVAQAGSGESYGIVARSGSPYGSHDPRQPDAPEDF